LSQRIKMLGKNRIFYQKSKLYSRNRNFVQKNVQKWTKKFKVTKNGKKFKNKNQMLKMNKIVQNENKVQQRKSTKNKKSPKLFQKCSKCLDIYIAGLAILFLQYKIYSNHLSWSYDYKSYIILDFVKETKKITKKR